MSRQTRAWQLLLGASLLLGCNSTATNTTDIVEGTKCGAHTKCPFGYECNYGGSDPNNPQSIGECKYKECGLKDVCKKPQKLCALDQETAMCDRFDNDKYCECERPNSEEVPSTPTTGVPPTTGDKP